MNPQSPAITEEKLARLREIVPEAFAEGKVDWEKLRVALGVWEFKDGRYHLNWAGKTGAFRALQSPTAATLAPCREESVDFDHAEHVFIEGENLAVLKVLQKSYFGKIKMIYIDPPYNTGNDHFIYPDRFAESKKDYMKRVGDMDDAGHLTREGLFRKNSRENGHYHSNWLSMICPRLFLARNLLREDGVIFVSIDDHEAHNLRLVMNELVGEENFFAVLTRKAMHTVRNSSKDFNLNADYVLAYGKNKSWFEQDKSRYIRHIFDKSKNYPHDDNDGRGQYKLDPLHARNYYAPYEFTFQNGVKWSAPKGRYPVYSQATLQKLEAEGRIVFSGKEPKAKRYLSEVQEGQPPNVILDPKDVGFNADGTREVRELFGDGGIFSQPKPSLLVKFLLNLLRDKDAMVLDFFAGSCTTAHAVLDLNFDDGGNRKFICVQMPEACDEKSEARKAGYKTIADIGKERIRRVLKNSGMNTGLKVFKLRESNFKQWRGDVKDADELAAQMQLHTDPLMDGAEEEDILYELLLKSGVSLTARMRDHGSWYLVEDADAKIAVALTRIDVATVKDILAASPDKVITLDRLFQNNDQLKTNTALQMEDAGVGFDVV